MENETKKCKHCQSDIPKKAKVCPVCRKKQKKGIFKWIIIAIIALIVIAAVAGGGNSDTPSDSNPKKTGNVDSKNTEKEENTESVQTSFKVGDIVETSDLKISFLSAGEYKSDNEFIQPKDGYMYYRAEFEFENISDSDKTISSMLDWACYADSYSMDQSWVGDDVIDATISSGKKAKGAIYFEVPVDANEITIEYETSFWTENKIEFIAK